MSTGSDIAKALDGPAGWAIVLIVGYIIIYKTTSSVVDDAAKAEQSFSCWFNNTCLLAELLVGKPHFGCCCP